MDWICSISLRFGELVVQGELFVMFLKPFSVAGCIVLLREVTAIREHDEEVYRNQGSPTEDVQSITLPPSDCLLPIVHLAAISSPAKQRTHTQSSTIKNNIARYKCTNNVFFILKKKKKKTKKLFDCLK